MIECIARNTPLLVNRHPAVEEYLGAAYPLFYERFEEAGNLLTDEHVMAAHRYLVSLDKQRFHGDFFRQQIASAVTHSATAIPLKIA